VDRLARRGVAALARRAVRALDGQPAGDRDLGALADGLGENAEQRIDDAGDRGLALSGVGSDGGDQIGLVE
jgi:hypothetical protein